MASKRVLVEVRIPANLNLEAAVGSESLQLPGFTLDTGYTPITLPATDPVLEMAGEQVMLVRGEIEEGQEATLRAQPNVLNVWNDAPIAPFQTPAGVDCDTHIAKGALADVAQFLQCPQLWERGMRGQGIVIGICDSGVNQAKVPALAGGWAPAGSSYTPGSAPADSHGTMCAYDASGICPEARIYDIAILAGGDGFISNAIAAYSWALQHYQQTGVPHILSNSWGLYQKSWAEDYATDPTHPFTRLVQAVIAAGIIVTFAAGNCGQECPDSRCGADKGPGRSIWGANGHPAVITVGAVNLNEQRIGYSSQGPASLSPHKPDVCAPSQFQGNTACDNGTSAANPVCAGVIGLLKSHNPAWRQEQIKAALRATARSPWSSGWTADWGYGIIQAFTAYQHLQGGSNVGTPHAKPRDWKQAFRQSGDYDHLANLLAGLREMKLDRLRVEFVEEFLRHSPRKQDVIGYLEFDSGALPFAKRLIEKLLQFGQDEPGRETLGLLINYLRDQFGGGAEAEFLRSLLLTYPLHTTPVATRGLTDWRGHETPQGVQEKVIGENTLRDVRILELAQEAARAVVRICTPESLGSGFLAGRGLIMTNHHVIATAQMGQASMFEFNYQLDRHWQPLPVFTARAAPDGLFYTNAELDVTVVEIETTPDSVPPLTLARQRVERDSRVNIIQHPGGHYKKISLQNNFVAYADARVLHYLTTTQPGSSGSPILDNEFVVVGIHHSGGQLAEPGGNQTYLRNGGSSMIAVLDALRGAAPEIYRRLCVR
jgi:subtilisin family serine protease/V8-like Glu-specific endopeptidase